MLGYVFMQYVVEILCAMMCVCRCDHFSHNLGVSISSAVISVSVAKSDSKFSLLEQLNGESRVHISFPVLHGRFPRNPQVGYV